MDCGTLQAPWASGLGHLRPLRPATRDDRPLVPRVRLLQGGVAQASAARGAGLPLPYFDPHAHGLVACCKTGNSRSVCACLRLRRAVDRMVAMEKAQSPNFRQCLQVPNPGGSRPAS